MSTRLQAVLVELASTERDLQRAWGSAAVAITNGTLSEPARDALHRLRDQVYAIEQAVHLILQRATANIPGFRLDEWIPVPTRMADLPPLTGGSAAQMRVAGLGVPVPPAVWAVVALVAIVEVAALAWAVAHLAEVSADFVVRLYQVRQNTLRYEHELNAQQTRFHACLRAGGTFERCGSTFALPQAPTEDTSAPDRSSTLTTGLAVVGAAAVVGGGVWAWRKYARRK